MVEKKVILASLIGWIVLILLVCFTNVLGHIPGLDLSMATRDYWRNMAQNPENVSLYTIILIYAGPMVIFFLVFWYLWIQKNLQEILLAAYARSLDIHGWLKQWGDLPSAKISPRIKSLARQAKRTFKNLDWLVVMANSGNWRWRYCGYLPFFYIFNYIFNAPKISAYSDVRVEPAPESWPEPKKLAHSGDSEDVELARNALDFSRFFTDGVKAWTGLEFLLHSVTGSVCLGALSIIAGGVCVLTLLHYTGFWSRPVLFALTCSLVLGVLIGHVWQTVSFMSGKSIPSSETISSGQPMESGTA